MAAVSAEMIWFDAQVREHFDEQRLFELRDSIKLHGQLQELVVLPAGEDGGFFLRQVSPHREGGLRQEYGVAIVARCPRGGTGYRGVVHGGSITGECGEIAARAAPEPPRIATQYTAAAPRVTGTVSIRGFVHSPDVSLG